MKTADVYIEVTARVRYHYAPAEPATLEYPGAPEECEAEAITGLKVNGTLYPISDDLGRAMLDADRVNIEAACIESEVEAWERAEEIWIERKADEYRRRREEAPA